MTRKEAKRVLMIMREEGEEFEASLILAFSRAYPEYEHLVLAALRRCYPTSLYDWGTPQRAMEKFKRSQGGE